jgi:hypothetical protein
MLGSLVLNMDICIDALFSKMQQRVLARLAVYRGKLKRLKLRTTIVRPLPI